MPGNNNTTLMLQDRDLRLLEALDTMRVANREQAKVVAGFRSTTRANARLLALTRAGSSAEGAVPVLTAAVKRPENRFVNTAFHLSIRQQSIQALGKIGPAARDAIPPLIEALSDQDLQTRSRAITALGCIGADAMTAVPMLIVLLKEKNEMIQELAASALAKISPKDAAKAGVKMKD